MTGWGSAVEVTGGEISPADEGSGDSEALPISEDGSPPGFEADSVKLKQSHPIERSTIKRNSL